MTRARSRPLRPGRADTTHSSARRRTASSSTDPQGADVKPTILLHGASDVVGTSHPAETVQVIGEAATAGAPVGA